MAGAFLKLGLTSFGGPIAHLSYIRAECVDKRRWLDDDAYADIVALCQFLPGPASSQVVLAVGMHRAGLPGGVVACLCFLLPSAVLMIAFGYGVAAAGGLAGARWLHGLMIAAVAVVAQAVWSMGVKLWPDKPRLSLCLVAASVILLVPGAPSLFAVLLVAPRLIASATGNKTIAVFDSFYRPGALVFGGGHVVLPLLRQEIVPRGWISDDAFLAGYGAAQAVPGPLFSFAGYLGTVIRGEPNAWLGGVLCLLAVFLPGWLLLGGALPFWHQLRAKAWMQAALRGANAAVVGILVSALYTPVITEGIKNARDVAVALVAFGLLEHWKAPPWTVVLLTAAAGQWILR